MATKTKKTEGTPSLTYWLLSQRDSEHKTRYNVVAAQKIISLDVRQDSDESMPGNRLFTDLELALSQFREENPLLGKDPELIPTAELFDNGDYLRIRLWRKETLVEVAARVKRVERAIKDAKAAADEARSEEIDSLREKAKRLGFDLVRSKEHASLRQEERQAHKEGIKARDLRSQ